jgi:hypothetical protein
LPLNDVIRRLEKVPFHDVRDMLMCPSNVSFVVGLIRCLQPISYSDSEVRKFIQDKSIPINIRSGLYSTCYDRIDKELVSSILLDLPKIDDIARRANINRVNKMQLKLLSEANLTNIGFDVYTRKLVFYYRGMQGDFPLHFVTIIAMLREYVESGKS